MRKVILAVIGFAVVGIGTTIYVMMNMDEFVKDAIQTFASEATRTPVSVAEVKLALESGDASIIGLNVSNPDGFSTRNIFELGMISIKIDPETLNQNPVMIDEVIISNPLILHEVNQSGSSNVDVLKNSLIRADSQAGSSSADSEDSLRMIIGKLVIEGGRVNNVRNTEQAVTLPTTEVFDIGKTSGGVTAVEVARILSSTLLDHVKNTVARLDAGSTSQ